MSTRPRRTNAPGGRQAFAPPEEESAWRRWLNNTWGRFFGPDATQQRFGHPGWGGGGGGAQQAGVVPQTGTISPLTSGGFGTSPLPGHGDVQSILGMIGGQAPGLSSEYLNALQAGQQAQLAPLEERLRVSLGELARREQMGDQLLGQMPQQFADITQQGQSNLTGLGESIGQTIGGAAPVSLGELGLTGAEGVAPGLGAMEAIQASRLSDLPYLQAGQQQFFGGLRTAAEMEHAQAVAAMQQQQQQILAQMAIADLQERGAFGRAQMGMAGDLHGQVLGGAQDLSLLEREAELAQQLGGSTGLAAFEEQWPKAVLEVQKIASLNTEPDKLMAEYQNFIENWGSPEHRALRERLVMEALKERAAASG